MLDRSPITWRLRTRTLSTADHTLIMGVLNVTPDSFSDGGRFFGDAVAETVAAVAHGAAMSEPARSQPTRRPRGFSRWCQAW